jgi:hypothetical protein
VLALLVTGESAFANQQSDGVMEAATIAETTNMAGYPLLPFIFSFIDALQDCKARFLGIGNREGLRRVKSGPYAADGFLAGGAVSERRGREWAAEGEFTTTDFAVALA